MLFLPLWGQTNLSSYYVSLRNMGQPKYKKNFSHFSYANPKAPKGGHLSLYTSRRFNTLNPYVDVGVVAPQIDLVFATLLKSARDNMEVAYPYLAESIIVDAEYKGVTFTLHKNAVFHDGTPISAEDVVFSFNLLKKEGKIILRTILQQVEKVEVLNTHTVKFIFQSANRDLAYHLGFLPILSKKSLEGKEGQRENLLLGSGPYKVQTYDLGNFIVYERVKDWWGENLPSNKGFYNFDTVKVTCYADPRVGFEAFKKGLVDWWVEERISNWYKGYDFPSFHRGDVIRIAYEKPFYHGLTGLFINTRRSHLADYRVRKALSLLFDFEWLNKTRFFNSYKRNISIFMNSGYGAPPIMSGAEQKLCQMYSRSLLPSELFEIGRGKKKRQSVDRDRVHQALALLEDAGWILKRGVLVSKRTGQPMHLNLVVYSPGHIALFQDFLRNLKKVGIQAQIRGTDFPYYMTCLRNLDFDIILHFHPHVVIPGAEQELFWASRWSNIPSTLNLPGVENSVVDDLVSKIKAANNLQDLKIYTALLDRIITLGYYLIPGWTPQKSYLAYWRKLNVLQRDASLYDIDTWWARALENKG
jgi:microcin C transport system substrate-binding protein